ncbi:hypothetical protein Y1Q_0002357 [Alligator mississippiensis]|uniref:Uncharacterized protein n=1 Tax=Alligator mississippiensis TaxID=8496 RepID=A0A151MGV7_ALLMI|nr:hypothetical protein Y1Q_0002357 [Alligator mississippiensis]
MLCKQYRVVDGLETFLTMKTIALELPVLCGSYSCISCHYASFQKICLKCIQSSTQPCQRGDISSRSIESFQSSTGESRHYEV